MYGQLVSRGVAQSTTDHGFEGTSYVFHTSLAIVCKSYAHTFFTAEIYKHFHMYWWQGVKTLGLMALQAFTHLTPSNAGRMMTAMQNGMYRRKYDTRGFILLCKQKS